MTPNERLVAQSRWLHLLLVHLCGPRVRSRLEIDDLVQEVFLRALTAPSGVPPEDGGDSALRRFLARLARNCVYDILRAMRANKRQGHEVRLARSDWSVSGVNPSEIELEATGPATRAIRDEEHRSLIAAFESLSRAHRRVIGLRQLEGRSAAETAGIMSRSEAAIHSLYRRALKAWGDAAR